MDGKVIQARPLTRTERLARWCKRNPVLTTAVAVIILLTCAGGAVTFNHVRMLHNDLVANHHWTHLETQPCGARVVFVPVHEDTRELLVEQALHPAARTPPTHVVLSRGE